MRHRSALIAALIGSTLTLPAPLHAQKAIEVSAEILDRFFTAYDKQKNEEQNVAPQLAAQDEKIKKFEECKAAWEAGGQASGSKLGGFAAKMAIRAKCGASDADGYRKDRQKILDGPENAAAQAGGFKVGEYRNLRDRLNQYALGDESGFSANSLSVLKGKKSQLASVFGVPAVVAQAGSSGGAGFGAHGPSVWTTDYAWAWIYQFFAIQYLSGATMFESNYKPGEWTKWQISVADQPDAMQQTERAFIGKTADGGEWWRMRTIANYKDGDNAKADTVTLEALFKPQAGNEEMQQLVRMRGKLPGNPDAQELMVPQQYAMWNMTGSFGMKPTQESIDGATVGVEDVKTPAGTFKAKHVRFGQGGGSLDWWLDQTAPGGWVKFTASDNDRKARYTMELIGRGTGAKSELGVMKPGAPAASAPPTPSAAPAASSPGVATAPTGVAAITSADLDKLVRGIDAANAQAVRDSTTRRGKMVPEDSLDAYNDRYHQVAIKASGLSESDFGMLLERVRAFVMLQDESSQSSYSAYVFTAGEVALMKPRLPTLKRAIDNTRW